MRKNLVSLDNKGQYKGPMRGMCAHNGLPGP